MSKRAKEPDGPELAARASQSIAELRAQGREPVRIRLHPLDWEEIVSHYSPSVGKRGKSTDLARLFGQTVELDELARLGEPVAEWEAPADG